MFVRDKSWQSASQTSVDKSAEALTRLCLIFILSSQENSATGDVMKRLSGVVLAVGMAFPAFAGGLTEPAMDPEVVAADVASSGGDNWVGVVMTLLVLGAALTD